MTQPARHPLRVEFLETRELPSGTVTETFNTTAPPGVPADWARWGSDGTNVFATAAGQGLGGSIGLVSNAGSRAAGLAWVTDALPGDTAVAASVRADSLVPTFVFARGSNAGSATPTYLAAVVTRGLKLQLWEVTAGSVRVLASVASPGSAYLSGQWVRITLTPEGSAVAVQVQRADTGQYLAANGTWQAAQADAVRATTAIPEADGFVGVGRAAAYAGAVRVDDFAYTPPTATGVGGVDEDFDTTPAGGTPSDWDTWTGGAPGSIGAKPGKAQSAPNGFSSSGGTTTSARGWASADLPAGVDAAASVFLDSLIPARVFVRGSGLDTATPTYYAASITRGLTVQLVRVVNGAETVLGAVKSDAYVSGQWVRVRVIAEGDRLRVSVYRTDTRQWLTSDGGWSDVPDFVLEKRDGAITGGGKAGVARAAIYSGEVTFDDFTAAPAGASAGPVVTITPPSTGTLSGEVTFRASAAGSPNRIEFRLDGQLRSVSAASPGAWTLDTTTLTNGTYTLTVRAFDAAGNVGTAEYTFTTSNAASTPITPPSIPRHYTHIRIAQFAYSGNPMGAFEQGLLRNSVDLVIPNTRYLSAIQATSPNTPQLIYSNVSNLYQGLLTDWLAYADRNGTDREAAFYHVTKATPFTGGSPSSQPVNWFWGGYQTTPAGAVTDVTSAVRGGRNFNVTFGGAGTTTALGYTDRFRELNVTLVSGAAAGWGGVWEYASAVDAAGKPTTWKTLSPGQDGTNGLKQSGRITFDPPADWVAASVGGSSRLFYVRFRVTAGAAAGQPELKTVFGRDYVNANGTQAGTIPAFDHAADANKDGHLTDAEYANRRAGMDARFEYEGRLFYPYYGQMRFVTNPSAPSVRRWAGDYHVRLLAGTPLADGIFMDNAIGRLPFQGVSVQEPTVSYGTDSGALMAAVSRAIEPRWVLANTAGGGAAAAPISAGSAGSFEEFLLRPLQANWSEVGDAVNLINLRLAAPNGAYLVIDSLPAGGSPTDPRTQLATLAYYYLVADPDRTFLMFFGGHNPASSWTEHWTPAAAVDVGKPTGAMRELATGADPANPALTYKVFARDYGNGLAVYKPLSYALGKGEGTTGTNTTTTHQLGGQYRAVRADGTLGPVVTAVALRNGEGAVFVKA